MWKQKNTPTRRVGSDNAFTEHFHKGRDFLFQAVELDEKYDETHRAKKMEACELYKKGIDEFKKACEINTMEVAMESRKEVAEAKEKINGFLRSAQERFLMLCDKLNAGTTASSSSGVPTARRLGGVSSARTASPSKRLLRAHSANTTGTTAPTVVGIPSRSVLLKGVDAKFGERLLDELLDSTGIRMSDVAGCEAAKSALEEAVILPSLNPSLFSGLRQPVKGILLFGPPGNGKTMLAKAVASEAKQVFFNLSAASLTSKWVGDAEKTIRCLFQIARNAQPSIIFIDEIDSILCDRSEKDTEVSRRMKTEFLVQFDGATSNPDDRVLVIGATNRPQELDDAVLRRFPKRILLGLPDDAGRITLINSILRKHNMSKGLLEPDIKYIASRTSGYSNSDLVSLCKEAAMVPVRGIDRTKLASTDHTKLRNLKPSDFDKALTVIKPSTSPRHMESMYEFAKRAGQAT